MKILLPILVLLMLAQCSKPKSPYNIEITNKAFDTLFAEFKKETKHYSHQNVDSLAVAIRIKEDTTVTLYANKELRPDYYLGMAYHDSVDVRFYSDKQESIKGLFTILYEAIKAENKELNDLPTCDLRYNRSYKYSRGKFYLK